MKKIRFIVVGAKWHDKVNGNTYNNAKILDTKTGQIYYKGYSYGYGNSYYHDAIEFIKSNFGWVDSMEEEIKDMGAFWINKKECKNGQF